MSVEHFSVRIEPTLGSATIPVDRQSEALTQRVARHSIPYPGLRSFEIHEASLYFGREEATSELLQKLDSNRFVAVVGPSGSGKSSLVKAGLVPALGADFVSSNGLPWTVVVLRPGPAPIRALAGALWELTEADGDGAEDAKAGLDFLEATLRRGEASDLVSLSRESRGMKGKNLLIVVDQFEDLFRFGKTTAGVGDPVPFGLQPIEQPPANGTSGTLGSSGAVGGEAEATVGEQSLADENRLFVELLLDATSQAEVPIYVVVTLRTQYIGPCVGFQGLHEAVGEGQYSMPPMTREQITQAIFCPAAASNVFFAARLMDRLLEDMNDKPDRLCVLQEALVGTWSHWKADPGSGRWLDLHHYEGAGGMAGALSQHADEVYYLGLPSDAARQSAERLFKRLTVAGIPGHDWRCPARLGELGAIAAVDTQEMADVVTAFRTESRSFLVSIPDGPLTADSYVDITHESLISAWKRLRQWVEEEAGSAALYRRLAETALLHEKGEAGLWRNPDLKLAEAWYGDQAPSPVWAQRYNPHFHAAVAYLQMSKTAARRRKLTIASVLALVPVALLALPWGGPSPLSLLGWIGDVADMDGRARPETAAFETIAADDKGLATPPSQPAEIPSIVMKIAIPPRSAPVEQLATEAIGAAAVSVEPEAGSTDLDELVSDAIPAAEPSTASPDPGAGDLAKVLEAAVDADQSALTPEAGPAELGAPVPDALPATEPSTASPDPGTGEDLAKVLEAAVDTDQSVLTRRPGPLPEDAAGSGGLSAEVQAIAEALLAEPEQASPVSATIRAQEDFVICREVRHLEPVDIASRFSPGSKVYAFAWVQTPKSQERITAKWLGDGDEVLGTNRLTVRRNMQRGYRTYTARTFSVAGRYEVRLYDESERLIGRREFTIE